MEREESVNLVNTALTARRAGVMLATMIEERSPVVQVIERTGVHYDIPEEFGEVRGLHCSERLVLECDCRAKLVLKGHASVRHLGLSDLECGICGGRFVLTLG